MIYTNFIPEKLISTDGKTSSRLRPKWGRGANQIFILLP